MKFSFAIFSLNTIMQLISTKQALEDILKNIKYTNCTIEHGQLALISYIILIVMTDDVNDSYMRTITLMTMTTMLMI